MVAFGGDYYLLSLIVLYVLQPSSLGLRCKGKLNILIRQLFFANVQIGITISLKGQFFEGL